MKTIGYCEGCKWWIPIPIMGNAGVCKHMEAMYDFTTRKSYGCIHWEPKESRTSEHFPLKSEQDLKIEDLQRENDAAFLEIQRISRIIVGLGYDPTQKP